MLSETKNRIIQSAIEVFNKDFSAPLQKVADNANITRRTLHRYFTIEKNWLQLASEKWK